MHKKLATVSFGLILWAFIFASGACWADPVCTGQVAGDDEVWVWGYDGSGNWGGTGWLNNSTEHWWITSVIFGSPHMGDTVDLYFAVRNFQEIIPGTDHSYPPGELNPAGLLVDITASCGSFKETGTNKLLTDAAHWEVLAHSGWTGDPVFDPTGLGGWVPATAYGANDSPTLWNEVMGYNPVPGIDGDAQWIWTANNFNPGMDNYAILHTRITVTPEPATIVLFGLGGVTAVFIKRKRKV